MYTNREHAAANPLTAADMAPLANTPTCTANIF